MDGLQNLMKQLEAATRRGWKIEVLPNVDGTASAVARRLKQDVEIATCMFEINDATVVTNGSALGTALEHVLTNIVEAEAQFFAPATT